MSSTSSISRSRPSRSREALATPEPRIQSYGEQGNIHRLQAFEFGDVNESARQVRPRVRGFVLLPGQYAFAESSSTPRSRRWMAKAKLTLWSSTQVPHLYPSRAGQALQIPPAHVRDRLPERRRLRGKMRPGTTHEIVVSKAAITARPPVKICLTREESLLHARGRHPVLMKMRTGVTKDGKITGMHTQTLLDAAPTAAHARRAPSTRRASNHNLRDPRYSSTPAGLHQQAALRPKRGHGTPAAAFRPGSAARQDRGRD